MPQFMLDGDFTVQIINCKGFPVIADAPNLYVKLKRVNYKNVPEYYEKLGPKATIAKRYDP